MRVPVYLGSSSVFYKVGAVSAFSCIRYPNLLNGEWGGPRRRTHRAVNQQACADCHAQEPQELHLKCRAWQCEPPGAPETQAPSVLTGAIPLPGGLSVREKRDKGSSDHGPQRPASSYTHLPKLPTSPAAFLGVR